MSDTGAALAAVCGPLDDDDDDDDDDYDEAYDDDDDDDDDDATSCWLKTTILAQGELVCALLG